MPASWANEAITRKRFPTKDSFGTEVVDYAGTPETSTIEGCWVEPLESTVDDDGQILTITAYQIAAPFDADVRARDLISHSLAEGEWVAVGDARRTKSPTGALDQSLITIRRWQRDGA